MNQETAGTPRPEARKARPAPWGLCDCGAPLTEKDHLSTPRGHDVRCEWCRHEIWVEAQGFWDD